MENLKQHEVIYKEASIKDWDNLAKFRSRYSFEDFNKAKNTFEIDFLNSENNKNKLFIASHQDKLIGYGRVGLHTHSDSNEIYGQTSEVPEGYYTKGLLIDEAFRGKGIGRTLTILRENWVKDFDNKIYCILSLKNNNSVQMHLKLGFKEIKKNLCYPSDKPNEMSGCLYIKEIAN